MHPRSHFVFTNFINLYLVKMIRSHVKLNITMHVHFIFRY